MVRRNLIGTGGTLVAALATIWAGSAGAECTSTLGSVGMPMDGATIICDDSDPNPFPGPGSVGGGANLLDVDILPNASIETGPGDDGIEVGDDSTVDHEGGEISGDLSGISANSNNTININGDVSLGLPVIEGRTASAVVLGTGNTVSVTTELGVVRAVADGHGFEFGDGNVINNAADIELATGNFDGFNGGNGNTIVNSGNISSLELGILEVQDGFDLGDNNSVTSAEGPGGDEIKAAEWGYRVGSGNTIINRSDIDAGMGGFSAGDDNSITNSAFIGTDGRGFLVGSRNTILNSGSVFSDIRTAADGIVAIDDNVIVNTGRGEIRGDGTGISAGDRNEITNDGFIQADNGNGLELGDFNNVINSGGIRGGLNAEGVELNGEGNVVVNTGIIEGDLGGIASLGANTTIVNTGEISGGGGPPSIEFTSGTNNLTLGTGSILVGRVDGGAGTDNLFLEGTGSENNDILDFENLTMQGAAWELSGDLDIDDTQILSGRLEINGTLTGNNVTVDGGILAGNGTITADVVNSPLLTGNHSVVAPGSSSIGVLTIDGNYTQGPNGVLSIGINGAGESDQLVVTGNADLDGTLLVDSDAGGDFVDAVVVADSITGFFDQVVAPTRGFAGATLGTTGPLETVLVGAVGPSIMETRVDAALDAGFLLMDTMTSRLQGVRDGTPTFSSLRGAMAPLLASSDSSLANQLLAGSGPTRPIKTEGGPGLWVRGVGWYGERDSDGSVPGYDYTLAGVAVGRDWEIGETGYVVGAGFNYTHAESDIDSSSSNNEADNYLIGAYLGYDRDNYFFDVAVGGGFSDYDSDRRVSVGGVATEAEGDFDGKIFAVRAAAGMDFAVEERFIVRPILSLDYVWVEQDGYTESGAGLGNMKLDDLDAHALKLQGMVALTQSHSIGNDKRLISEIRAGVVGQFALGDRDVDAALPALGATGALAGNDSDEVRAALGIGATLLVGNDVAAYASLGGEFGSDTRNATGTVGVRFDF